MAYSPLGTLGAGQLTQGTPTPPALSHMGAGGFGGPQGGGGGFSPRPGGFGGGSGGFGLAQQQQGGGSGGSSPYRSMFGPSANGFPVEDDGGDGAAWANHPGTAPPQHNSSFMSSPAGSGQDVYGHDASQSPYGGGLPPGYGPGHSNTPFGPPGTSLLGAQAATGPGPSPYFHDLRSSAPPSSFGGPMPPGPFGGHPTPPQGMPPHPSMYGAGQPGGAFDSLPPQYDQYDPWASFRRR